MAMTYRIEIPGTRPRRAATLHNARVAFGQLACQVPNGTIGEITRIADGELVEQGVVDTLGWVSTADYPLETAMAIVAGDLKPYAAR